MSATRASRVQPFGRATLGRSPKDLAKPYLDRKYKSVQTRQYLLGGFGVDPGHWSLNRAHTDAASGVTVAVDTVMAAEKVEEVLVTKLATAGVETLAMAALEKGGEGRTGLVLAEKKVEECGGKNCRAAGMAACKDKGGLEDFSFLSSTQVFEPGLDTNCTLKPVSASTNLEHSSRSKAPISLKWPSNKSVATLHERSVKTVFAAIILLSFAWLLP